jgi:hypothetical protein
MRRPSIPDSFTRQYIATALWSSNDESTPSGGYPLDKNYGEDDIATATLADMIGDAQDFQRKYADLLQEAYDSDVYVEGHPYDESNAGHDFWLTRNHHGAGFWDRGLPKALGQALTDAAHRYGEYYLFVERGKVMSDQPRRRTTTRKSGKSRRGKRRRR